MKVGAAGNRRLWWLLGIGAWMMVSILALALVLLAFWYRQSADYPGSLSVGGDHTIYRLGPVPTIRRDTAYRTTDAFNKVYNWYSSGFELGPEAYAQSQCIMMAHAFTDFWIVKREMTVTVCDTPKERMIFVMRSLALRWH